MKQFFVISIFLTVLSSTYGQRVAPGVPPQHYESPPAYQQNYQPPGQNYQPPNVNPQQYHPNQQVPVQHVDQYGNVVQQQPPVVQHQAQAGHHPQAGHHNPNPGSHQAQAQPVGGHQAQPVGGHHHGHHGAPQQVLHTGNLQMEKEHIAEHMDVPIDTSKMTDQELQFHYFKMHDADNNNKLDGCELIKSLIHWHEENGKKIQVEVYSDEQISSLIDFSMNSMDKNKDGFITYNEFIRSGQKE